MPCAKKQESAAKAGSPSSAALRNCRKSIDAGWITLALWDRGCPISDARSESEIPDRRLRPGPLHLTPHLDCGIDTGVYGASVAPCRWLSLQGCLSVTAVPSV